MARTRRSGYQRQLRRAIRSLYHRPEVHLPPRYYEELLNEFDCLTSAPATPDYSEELQIVYENLRRRKPFIRKIEILVPPLRTRILPRAPRITVITLD